MSQISVLSESLGSRTYCHLLYLFILLFPVFGLVDTYIYRHVFIDNIHIYVHVSVQLCVYMYVYGFVWCHVITQPLFVIFLYRLYLIYRLSPSINFQCVGTTRIIKTKEQWDQFTKDLLGTKIQPQVNMTLNPTPIL